MYFDDFLMSGPKENMDIMWKKIAQVLKIDEPAEMGLYLGCVHEEGKLEMNDGRIIRTMTFNQEGFFSEKVEKYFDLCKKKGEQK